MKEVEFREVYFSQPCKGRNSIEIASRNEQKTLPFYLS